MTIAFLVGVPASMLASLRRGRCALLIGAGGGNRTRVARLEIWNSTIELHPRVSNETRISLGEHLAWGCGTNNV